MEYIPNSITQTPGGYIIYPYAKGQCKALETITSYIDKPRHQIVPYTGFINPQDKTFVTHSGIEPEFLRHHFPTYKFVTQNLIKPKNAHMFSFSNDNFGDDDMRTRLRYQCISALFNQSHLPRSFIKVQTGFGKTAIALEYISIRGKKAMINCYSSKVLRQFFLSLGWMTDIDVTKRAIIIQSSQVFTDVLNGDFDTDRYDIYLCTPKLIQGFASRNGWSRMNLIFDKMGIGTRIVDEAHRHIKSTIFIDAYTSIPKTIYMTADLRKSQYIKNRQFTKIFSGIPIIEPSIQFESEYKYIDIVVSKYNSHPDIMESLSVFKRNEFSNFEFMRYEFMKGALINHVKTTLDTILESETQINDPHKILILVSLIEHVDELHEIINMKYGKTLKVGRYHGEVPPSEKEETLNSDIIISTYQSFGVGVDCKGIRFVLSLDQVNEVDDNQSSGRIRPMKDGLIGYYFLFCDVGIEYCSNNLSRRIRYLKECGKARRIFEVKF